MSALEWSGERIAEQFRAELRARFESENAAHRAEEAADIERARLADPERWERFIARCGASLEPSDSGPWTIYAACDVQIESNCVEIVLPAGWAIGLEFLRMLEGTSVAWTMPTLSAKIVDGEARVVVDLILVDYWDDERAAEWLRRGAPEVASSSGDPAPSPVVAGPA